MSQAQDESISREPNTEHAHTPSQQDSQTQIDSRANTIPTNASKHPEWLTIILTTLQDQWFLIGIGVVITIASQVQVPQAHQELKETICTYLMVSIIFFFTGCTLDTRVLVQNYSRWKVHIFVQAQCFLVTSALAFGLVTATATNKDFMDPGLLVGLIFLGCVATTMSSNVVMTRQAHGNSAMAVVQTTLGNFIGVFISPALVIMYTSVDTWYNEVLPSNNGQFGAIYARVLKQLGLSIYLPMFVGQVTRYFFEPTCQKIFFDWKLLKFSPFCMLVIMANLRRRVR
jgi:sodium/bile acid cotransporter 7